MVLLWLRWLYSKLVRLVFKLLWIFSSTKPPLLPPIEDPILLMSAQQLAQAIRDRKVSSEQAVRACIKRIHSVNPVLNAVVDERFSAAIEEAQKVDQLLAENNGDQCNLEQDSPLLGVPFTSKENVMVNGMSHTHGLVCRKGIKAKEDAGVIHLLKKAGGIPLCVTNIPELGLWWESFNHLYGRTCSPYDHSRTCGGSSGGETALLSSCCTYIGTGTDIGGSVRIPGAFSGVAGHKPSSGWVPTDGIGIFPEKCLKGGICVAGPLSRHVSELPFLLEIMAPTHAKGLREKVMHTQLKDIVIWYAEDLGSSPLYSPTHPQILKTLRQVLTYLESKQSRKNKKFSVDLRDAYKVWKNKGEDDFADEPGLECDILDRKGTLSIYKELPAWFLGKKQYSFPNLLNLFVKIFSRKQEVKTSPFYWKTKQRQCLDVLGKDGVIVMPSSPLLAPYHYEAIWNPFDFSYTSVWNAVEFPSTQVPLGITNDAQPIGLQVVSTPGNDHLCLAVAQMIEDKFGGWVNPSKIDIRKDKSV